MLSKHCFWPQYKKKALAQPCKKTRWRKKHEKSTQCKKNVHFRGSQLKSYPFWIINHFAVKTLFKNVFWYTLPKLKRGSHYPKQQILKHTQTYSPHLVFQLHPLEERAEGPRHCPTMSIIT